ncbi:YabP/YqfC family sporulation protein [Kyrpidia tusciae]|uniref:Sporulation protein YqfC n=1 Tax=Kyrpidia tusciae (strain DSM 2912 / NBRC 15312 / T2) TaxID=562970 RepID=D5WVB8_KYRT2|nr:YabP/YqfC family sporulation protein [Kyrpidia tusciae]ADG05528.1 hypothetical protein Btus_0769 [Kyrpidia tusciae DSM 2912]MBE3551661.1 hypothetical protein [Kyrpidia tusciae]
MGGRGRFWKSWATEKLQLPEDVIWDHPRVDWVPGGLLRLDNHGRIVSFREDALVVEFGDAELQVAGADLVLVRLSPDHCVIQGHVTDLSYRARKGREG